MDTRAWRLVSATLLVAVVPAWCARPKVELRGGVVTYSDADGSRRKIDVGKPCADLWVSPDGGHIAFIAIERSDGEVGGEPFVTRSTIYVARKQNRYNPVPLRIGPLKLSGRDLAYRNPKVSPDGDTVYFNVPLYATSNQLFAFHIRSHDTEEIGNDLSYCIMWGGSRTGTIVMQRRGLASIYPYQCFARSSSNTESLVSGDCDDLEIFIKTWNKNGGECK